MDFSDATLQLIDGPAPLIMATFSAQIFSHLLPRATERGGPRMTASS